MGISAVIIASSEEHTIQPCVAALLPCCQEVLVLVNNSSDSTAALAQAAGATVVPCTWQGYGATKNYGNNLATHNWILSIDADEVIDHTMCAAIRQLSLQEGTVYQLSRLLVWQGKALKFGSSREQKVRLFDRRYSTWNNSLAHEALLHSSQVYTQKLPGTMLHYAFAHKQEAAAQYLKYAQLMAKQRKGAPSLLKGALRAGATFVKLYFFKLGVLDGVAGLELAFLHCKYTFQKYSIPNTELSGA